MLALLNGVYELAYGYAYYTLEVDPGALPGAAWAAWVSDWTSPLSPPFLIAVAAAVPGRAAADAALALGRVVVRSRYGALVLAQYALAPGPTRRVHRHLDNPARHRLGRVAADRAGREPFYTPRRSSPPAAALVVRFRRSHGVERLQVKWLAFAASLMAALL